MNELKKIERSWLKNFQKSALVENGVYQCDIARGLFHGFDNSSRHKQQFTLGFQEFKDNLDYSDLESIKKMALNYLDFIGIKIKIDNLNNSINSGECNLEHFLKKEFFLLRQMARYDATLDIADPYYDNLGDIYYFMRIEASDSESNQQLSLFEEVPLPDFYNKYIELPDNYSSDKVALELFEEIENTNKSYFITGKAGTGKSTFIHYFTKNTNKHTLLFAFTGIAAINIGGQTLHSFFGFPFKPMLPKDDDIKKFNPNFQKAKILQSVRTIVVDEVSMLRSDILEALDYSLRINGGDPQKLFGGKQLIFVGDAFQLPPIVNQKDPVEKMVFEKVYNSEYFFDSPSFRLLKPKLFEFNKVHRQSDREFIQRLNKVRNYKVEQEDINYFNERYDPDFVPANKDFNMMLTSNNYIANSENTRRLLEIPYGIKSYKARIEGDFKEDRYPTQAILDLKRGAQVMFVKNDTNFEGTRRWVNGTIGKVIFLTEDAIEVEISDGNIYKVSIETWENRKYQWDKDKKAITSKVVGTFTQFPIKLAWAITVHKSQGLSFDKVHIDLGTGAFANGQLYTALSRCRSYEGLKLKKKITTRDIIADSRLVEFSTAVENGELTSNRTFTHTSAQIENIMNEVKANLNQETNEAADNVIKLKKLRLNSIIDFGTFDGHTLEKAISINPKYLDVLLSMDDIVISPSTIEIIEKRLINFNVPADIKALMKRRNENYLKQ